MVATQNECYPRGIVIRSIIVLKSHLWRKTLVVLSEDTKIWEMRAFGHTVNSPHIEKHRCSSHRLAEEVTPLPTGWGLFAPSPSHLWPKIWPRNRAYRALPLIRLAQPCGLRSDSLIRRWSTCFRTPVESTRGNKNVETLTARLVPLLLIFCTPDWRSRTSSRPVDFSSHFRDR